ncbi:MAG TPA: hypothetical protein VLV81_02045 [Acidimicrobiia bacterium]|nr:hypothetical protein [Acidimicrobiia bacterium]
MNGDRGDGRAPTGRRAAVASGILFLVLGGVAVGVVTTRTASPSSAATVSYCSASRTLDEYRGHDHAQVVALLERIQQRAPVEIAPVVRQLRADRPTSAAFRAAHTSWTRYNTNHCCSCVGGPNLPQLASTPPARSTP